MNWQENKDLASSLPVIPRLDRLDILLQLLEEKHGLSERHFSDISVEKKAEEEKEDQCNTSTVTLSSALEQVHHKGTLMERLTALENRVMQLSIEMDEGNMSRSSSSKSRQLSFKRNEKDEKANLQEKQLQEEATITEEPLSGRTDKVVGNTKMIRKRRKSYRKWLGWLHVRC